MTVATEAKMITDRQADYIDSLVLELGIPEELDGVEDLSTLTRKRASEVIDVLLGWRADRRVTETVSKVEKEIGEGAYALPDGYFTVVVDDEGHRTFRVKTVKNGGEFDGKHIISFLAGPDNESDYVGFGFVTETGVNFWKRFKDEGVLHTAVDILLGNIETAQKGYALHSGNCFVCGRLLTDPTSIELGIGPVCRGDA